MRRWCYGAKRAIPGNRLHSSNPGPRLRGDGRASECYNDAATSVGPWHVPTIAGASRSMRMAAIDASKSWSAWRLSCIGITHFTRSAFYLKIMPDYIPAVAARAGGLRERRVRDRAGRAVDRAADHAAGRLGVDRAIDRGVSGQHLRLSALKNFFRTSVPRCTSGGCRCKPC